VDGGREAINLRRYNIYELTTLTKTEKETGRDG
jgi:hypothetical protein